MNLVIASLIISCLGFSAQAQSDRIEASSLRAPLTDEANEISGKIKSGWSVSTYGRGATGPTDKTIATGVVGVGKFKFEPTSWLSTTIAPGAVIETGSVSSLFDSNIPRNQVFLDQAVIEMNAANPLKFSVGALNQRFLESPLLIDAQSFPGIAESYDDAAGDVKYSIIAQQAIPTSLSLSTMTSDKEPLPYFFTETARVEWQAKQDLKVTARATKFGFVNLPAQVAYKSSLNGNKCVTGDVPQAMRFTCQFEGYSAGAQVDWHIDRTYFAAVGADYIINTAAASQHREGYVGFGQLRFDLSSTWRLTSRGEFFFNESDTSPSFYNSVAYGHSNRQGYAAEFKLENFRQHFGVKARVVDARLVEESNIQADTTIIFLGLELSGAEI